MRTTILTLAVCGSCCALLAQNPAFEWVAQQGGTGGDRGNAVGLDAAGNAYTTGYFAGTVDFDPSPAIANLTSAGGADIFLTKFDPSGNLLWAKRIGNTLDDGGYALKLDAAGNIYFTGWFQGTTDFDPGPGTSNLTALGDKDIFIVKFRENGNFIWAKQMGGNLREEGRSIVPDLLGNLYVTGYFRGTGDFDPSGGITNLTATAGEDMFISKLDSAGNFIWAKQVGGSSNDWGRSMTVDATGNLYLTGHFDGPADFDPGAGTFTMTSAGDWDIFISKLDVSGNFLWAKQMGSTLSDGAVSMVLDALGNLYTAGWFNGTVDFDPGAGVFSMSSAGDFDAFIAKFDGSGNFVWAKQLGGPAQDLGGAITLDNSGNLYATGLFSGTADFDPSGAVFEMTSNGGEEIFIGKLDASGNLVWAKAIGGASSDAGLSIAVDNLDNVYTTGLFFASADFDPGAGTFNLTNLGADDGFLLKMSQGGLGIGGDGGAKGAIVYPNPTTGPVTVLLQEAHPVVHANVYDARGACMESRTYEYTSTITLELNVPPGVYLLKLHSVGINAAFQIAKTR